jgi:uncharacterized protein YhaN
MPERVERLRSLVRELEAELAAIDTNDAESQQALAETLRELRQALQSRGGEPTLPSDSIVERLRSAEEDFQITHPTISGLVVRMIDALGQLGI